jgi:ribosomal protein L11 methyltransferase
VIRLAVRVRREDAELALAELLTMAPAGVEEVDLGDRVEYAIYGAQGELPSLPDLRAAAGEALVEVTTSEVADDWGERWRDFHRPIAIADRLHVRAPWHPPAPAGLVDVVIDPGQAFGTGAHDTTRLCLELLCGLTEDGLRGAVVDVGCGSGVLAIAAAKLGAGPVLGVDHERESVQATLDNAAANGVRVQARRHDLVHDGAAPGAPLVLANLLRPLLLRVARDGFTGEQPRTLIASGLLRHEADEVAAALADRLGLREDARAEGGDWAALLLRVDGGLITRGAWAGCPPCAPGRRRRPAART